MKLIKNLNSCAFVLLALAVATPSFAYIDPGTGSYFVQMIVAGFASFMLFFVKPVSEKLKSFFKKNSPKVPVSKKENDTE